MSRWLADWTLRHGWFGWWLPGFISGAAAMGIVAFALGWLP